MATYSTSDQVRFVLEWFQSWSEFQRDDFVAIFAQKLSSPGQFINGLVNGLQSMDTSGRPPSLFTCQVKLFSEWWGSWNETDQERFKTGLKNSDGKFWSEVEAELNGTRKKSLDEEFYTVTVTTATVVTTNPPASTSITNVNHCTPSSTEVTAEEGKETTTTIIISGDENIKPTVMEVEGTGGASHDDAIQDSEVTATIVTVGES